MPQDREHAARAKADIRERARSARRCLDPGFCADAAERIAEDLLSLPELRVARVVMAYAASPEELDPAPVIEALHGLGKAVALPRVESPGVLGVHLFAHGDELEGGAFGIRQPYAHAPRLPFESIDAVIVPGVAFDSLGRRVGYGGGYYDRLLPQLRPDCLRIGIAYDEQLAEELPAEDHDERVHVVVTPTRVIHPGGRFEELGAG